MRKKSLNQLLLYVPAILLLTACNNPVSKQEGQANQQDSIPKKPSSTYQDTFTIDHKSVVFYYPDSLQLEKIRSLVDSGSLSSILHEYEYLEKNARNVMKEYYPGIPILQSKNKRYLLFHSPGRDSFIDLDKLGDPIGLFLFKPGNDPHLADLPNVASDLGSYFPGH